MGLYKERKGGDDLPWQVGAGILALHQFDDGASNRVIAGKLGLNETTVAKVLEKAKAQAQDAK